VQSLTVSDQHATLLLTHTEEKAPDDEISATNQNNVTKTIQSLLKLTIIPFHKQLLGSNPVLSRDDINKGQVAERNCSRHQPSESDKIISFLKHYKFQLSSDSGEEYSYYTANPDQDKNNSTEYQGTISAAISKFGSFDVEVISI